MVELSNTADVMEKLGGPGAVAKLTGRKYNAAQNWKGFETFPPDTFLVMTRALEALGYTARPALWRMTEAAE